VLGVRPRRLAAPALARLLGSALSRHWGLVGALIFTGAVHVPSVGYYFDGDDFVVLGSVEYLGAKRYMLDSWMMRDIVASWRPLTAMVYAAEWEVFGLHPLGWRLVNLGVHLTSVAMLYALVVGTTSRPRIGTVSAVIFGVSGAHFDTVNYITALPHLLATLFTLASLLAMVAYATRSEEPGADGHQAQWRYWLSFTLFLLAFLSNEGAFVYAPLMAGAYALFSGSWRQPLRLALHAAPFAMVAAAWVAFYQSCSCDQLKIEEYGWGMHVLRNAGVYLSWIAFPARTVPLSPDTMRWSIAAGTSILLVVVALRGPHIARLSAVGVVLALTPFVPVEIWTASRYTYGAVAFSAPVFAIAAYAIYSRLSAAHRLVRIPLTAGALLFVAVIAGLYAWQTHAQHARSGAAGERWRLLAAELRANYDDVPDGTTIYIIGGPWQNPMEQYTWVPSVARALYGDAAAFDLPRAAYENATPPDRNARFLEWRDGHLHDVTDLYVAAR
jgi:hypothetical protein